MSERLIALKGEFEVMRTVIRELEHRRLELENELRPALRAPSRQLVERPDDRSPRVAPERVRDVLLWVGATLLVISAFSLSAVILARRAGGDGPSLITPMRIAVLLMVFAAATVAVSLRLRRRLPATGEVLTVVAFGLFMASWYALRRGGVGEGVASLIWWSAGFALGALLAGAGCLAGYRVQRSLAPASLSAAMVLAVAALPVHWWQAIVAAALAAMLVGLAQVALEEAHWAETSLVSLVGAVGFVVLGVVLAAIGVGAATSAASAVGPAVAMVALVGPMALARGVFRRDLVRRPPALDAIAGLCTLSLIAAATFLAVPSRSGWVAVVMSAGGAVAVVAGRRFATSESRRGVTLAGAGTLVVCCVLIGRVVAVAMFAPLGWLSEPWHVDMRLRSDLLLAPSGTVRVLGGGWALVVIALCCVTTAAAATGWARLPRRAVQVGSVLVVAVVAALAPVVAHRAIGAVFGLTLGTALLFTLLAVANLRAGRVVVVPLVGAVAVAIPAAGWAATNRWATVGSLGAAAVVSALLAFSAARGSTVRSVALAMTALCSIGAWVALSVAWGIPGPTTGVTLAVVAGVLSVCAARTTSKNEQVVLSSVAALAFVVGLLLCARSAGHVATALTLFSALVVIASTTSAASWAVRWLAAGTGVGAVVAWLAQVGVTLLEAYTLTIGVAAIISGAVVRRSHPGTSSWIAYGPGMMVLLGPSLVVVLGSGPMLRSCWVVAVSVAAVAFGAEAALKAPLVLGTVALVVLAIDALRPAAVDVPKWIPIGVAGALILWIGATFERRMTTLRRLNSAYHRLN